MADLIFDIHKIVGDAGLLRGDDVKARAADWLGMGTLQAKALVRPKSTDEVSQVLALCHAQGQPVITIGGLTGLVHGTDAGPDDIILSTERMSSVGEIDPIGRTVIVDAGAQLQKVHEAVAEHGLQFALDLGARGSCTIGGNIATNAGGNNVLRFGMMRNQVLGLEAVLADGTVLSSMNTLLKNNTGYDLKQLFIGAEGTLGVVTRAVLRLQPAGVGSNTALIAVDDFDAVTRLFAYLGHELAGGLVAFEVMWQSYYTLIAEDTGRHQAPLPATHGFYIIVEQQISDKAHDTERFNAVMEKAIMDEMLADAVIAQSEAQAQAIWNIREDIEGLVMNMMPFSAYDVSLPIRDMNDYINTLERNLKAEWGANVKDVVFGHLGDGNLHLVVALQGLDADKKARLNTLVYGPLKDLGGSISAEHGIGVEKKNYLDLSRSRDEIATMKLIKSALDPKNILNPGKIFA